MTDHPDHLVVVQSRLSSSRMPAKALLTVGGRPMVVLAALRAANTGVPTVIATSDQPEDDLVASAGAAAGVRVVRGPLDDPLARFVVAAEGLADEAVVVRLTADNVVPDGHLVRLLADAVTPAQPYARLGGDDPALPYGVAGEAFTAGALRAAAADATDRHDREHVTPWLRRTHGDHRLTLGDARDEWRGLRCTVDTFDDFVTVGRLFASVEDPLHTPWEELCDRLAALVGPAPLPWPTDNAAGQSPLILGTVQLGVAYGAANRGGLPSEAEALAVLSAARAAGITHLDTARAYGESEARIGQASRRGLAEHVAVVTKIRPLDQVVTDAPEAWGRAEVEASLAASERALGASPVAVVLTHRAADWHRPGVREALVQARSEGRCSLVGVSLSTPEELVGVLTDPECGYVQLPFNLLDRRWLDDSVQAALRARQDLVVTCRSVYLQGLLVAGTDADWPTVPGVDPAGIMATLDELVGDLGRESRADLCLAYALGQAWVTSAVVGAESPEQVRDSADLARRAPLTADELATVRDRLPKVPLELVDPSRWRLP